MADYTPIPASALTALARLVPPDLGQGLEILLSQAADPAGAIRRLTTFCQEQPSWFQQLAYAPFGLQALIGVFSSSRFLSDDLLHHPEWLSGLLGPDALRRVRTAEELAADLESFLGPGQGAPDALRLAVFRRRQIMRILVRDLLGFAGLPEVTEELSSLADAILDVAYRRLRRELERRCGVPRLAGGAPCGFSILALGKHGAGELNYSSDIDLLFLYDGPGETGGENSLSTKEFFKKLSTRFTGLLSTHTAEGLCYRVDLRLRPEGRLGEVCISLDGARAYYANRARDWELQMLIKGRIAAGEPQAGRTLLDELQPRIYSTSVDFSAIESMSATRDRLDEKLGARRHPGRIDVKLARGGIRDIEFLTQCLQRLHGGRRSWLRNSSTLLALNRLRDADLISNPEYSRLANAYIFLRHLEHRLQFDDDRQTHTLPEDPDELALLARRMPRNLLGDSPSAETLLAELNVHFEHVQAIYTRVVHAQQPMYYSSAPSAPNAAPAPALDWSEAQAPNLARFLEQQAPRLAAIAGRARLGRAQAALERYLEEVLRNPEHLAWLERDSTLAGYAVDLFAHSPYLSEQLIRSPEYLEELRLIRAAHPVHSDFAELESLADDPAALRRYFLRQMFHLLAESVLLQAPVFLTLDQLSALADAAIRACYAAALHLSPPPPDSRGGLLVIALGRLGMSEFDLGSDADLLFVLTDEAAPEKAYWTRIAEKTVNLLSSYTREGAMFAVDTRLRPNGREGDLVQTEAAYRDYFTRGAQAWEGITYMKSRAIAGDIERGTRFLKEIQNLDWRRYGQRGRSRQELLGMRERLERELGETNPLKIGAGGYYDIDFALMYLRLRAAGLFYTVLNTPRRIEVVEQTGHLDPADARFLLDAATLHRAIDHGLRLMSGHTEGKLPNAPAQLETLTQLVSRWTPEHLHDQPLPVELAQVQQKTRDFFDRLFRED